jgi:hypothetical protein
MQLRHVLRWLRAHALHPTVGGWLVMAAPVLLVALGPCGGSGGSSGY